MGSCKCKYYQLGKLNFFKVWIFFFYALYAKITSSFWAFVAIFSLLFFLMPNFLCLRVHLNYLQVTLNWPSKQWWDVTPWAVTRCQTSSNFWGTRTELVTFPKVWKVLNGTRLSVSFPFPYLNYVGILFFNWCYSRGFFRKMVSIWHVCMQYLQFWSVTHIIEHFFFFSC